MSPATPTAGGARGWRPGPGDLALVVTEHRIDLPGLGLVPVSQAQLAVVTAATRRGEITRFRWARYHPHGGPSMAVRHLRSLLHLVPLPATDKAAAIRVAREHRWGNGGHFCPFDSVGQALRVLAPHLDFPADDHAPGLLPAVRREAVAAR